MMRFAIIDSSDDENLDSASTGIVYPEIVTGVWSDFGGFMNSADVGDTGQAFVLPGKIGIDRRAFPCREESS